MPQTLLEKIWNLHTVIPEGSGEETLLYVDRNFVHEESGWAFEALEETGRSIVNPSRNVAFADHYVPTVNRQAGLAAVADPEVRDMLVRLGDNAKAHGLRHFGIDDPRQGIMHVVAPELGFVLPGFVITGSDSHVCTNGAFGAFAFGVAQTELKQVFMTQTLWRKRPKSMKISVDGTLPHGVSAKDIVLTVIRTVGANGGAGHVIEYAGSCVAGMTIEQRMTICNMSIEMGAQSGIVAPDEITFEYLETRPNAPKGAELREAIAFWRTLPSDAGTIHDRELTIDAASVQPMVTWGTTLEDVVAVGDRVPDPRETQGAERQARMQRALRYMGLEPGVPIADIPVDMVFIGSCTNSRIEDLRAAAAIVQGHRAAVTSIVSPGSNSVKRQAEAEGLDEIFKQAGFAWRASGCSMCVGSNGDTVASGKRCASTSPRNFEGRQGVGARTHVMSPTMAAAAALTGRIVDCREFIS
jgi:3-isopropylmalate/(R)-2-methylmalate dehydratase large subunit